jgi:hypothetical protein
MATGTEFSVIDQSLSDTVTVVSITFEDYNKVIDEKKAAWKLTEYLSTMERQFVVLRARLANASYHLGRGRSQ